MGGKCKPAFFRAQSLHFLFFLDPPWAKVTVFPLAWVHSSLLPGSWHGAPPWISRSWHNFSCDFGNWPLARCIDSLRLSAKSCWLLRSFCKRGKEQRHAVPLLRTRMRQLEQPPKEPVGCTPLPETSIGYPSWLEYCNVLCVGLPMKNIRKLQLVQTAVAWANLDAPNMAHVTSVLCELHWILVCFWLQFTLWPLMSIMAWARLPAKLSSPHYLGLYWPGTGGMLWTLSIKEFQLAEFSLVCHHLHFLKYLCLPHQCEAPHPPVFQKFEDLTLLTCLGLVEEPATLELVTSGRPSACLF